MKDRLYCLVLPQIFNYAGKTINEQVIHNAHVDTEHGGVAKTLQELTNKYHWQNITNDVKEYVASCDTCQRIKYETQLPAGLLVPMPVPTLPFEDMSMDFISVPAVEKEIYRKKHVFCKIWVIVDMFSKFVFFIPLIDSYTARELIKLFMGCIYPSTGYPMRIVSDRDILFTSGEWKEWCQKNSIKLLISSTYHPQTDGLTERQNRALREMIKAHNLAGQDWYDSLSSMQMAMNLRVDSSRKTSPYFALFGKYPKLRPAMLPYPTNYITTFKEREILRQDMIENLIKAKIDQV